MKLTKKQLIITITAAVLVLATLTVALIFILRDKGGERQVFYYEDFSYVIRDDGKLEIIGYSGTDKDVTVPTSINSKSVYSIGEGAFRGNTAISTLTLGAMVREIGRSAFESCSSLEKITWGSLVTSIGPAAFRECLTLSAIELPDSVTSIGEYAFYGCSAVEKLSLPSAIKNIPDYAFCGCSKLESFDASNIDTVGAYAFKNCAALKLTGTENIKSFGKFAFENCKAITSFSIGAAAENIGICFLKGASNVASVTVADGNTRYSASTGALYDLAEKRLMYYPPKSLNSSYTLPADAKVIESYAFEACGNLDMVVLPSGLTSINDYAFSNSLGLGRIVSNTASVSNCDIPPSVTHIGGNAFAGTHFKKHLPAGFTVVGEGILINYTPENDTAGKSVVVPDGVKKISSAFTGSDNVIEVTLPASVTELSSHTFAGASGLVRVDMSRTSVNHLPDALFENTMRLTEVILPDCVRTSGALVFSGTPELKSISLPSSLEEIGHSMFMDSGLTTISIPKSVKVISAYAFARAKSLTEIKIPSSVESLGAYAFAESGLVEIKIPNIQVGDYLLFNCQSLTKAKSKIKGELPRGTFMGCTALTKVKLHRKTTSIGDEAFSNCTALEKIRIPRRVTSIGDYAFESCTTLKRVKRFGNRLLEIGDNAFYLDTNLKRFRFNRNLTVVGDAAFYGCASLKNPNLRRVEEIGDGTFAECKNITKVKLKNLKYNIPAGAFRGCTSLKKIKLSPTVAEIGNSAFVSCMSLKKIKLPDSLTYIGRNAFAGCDGLEEIKFNGQLKKIDDYAFYLCVSLVRAELPDTLESIGSFAFHECVSLGRVVMGSGVRSVGSYAFGNCTVLASVELSPRLTSIAEGTFANCESLASVSIPSGVTVIEKGAFSACTSLKTLELPLTLQTVYENAFEGCGALINLVYGADISNIFIGEGNDALLRAYANTPRKEAE